MCFICAFSSVLFINKIVEKAYIVGVYMDYFGVWPLHIYNVGLQYKYKLLAFL